MALDGESRTGERSLGLVSMRERAELMGGELHLSQPPQGGLIVTVRVPAGPQLRQGEEVA